MKAKAVRLHGENDLRLEDIELPKIGEEKSLRVLSPTAFACLRTRQLYRAPGISEFPKT